MSSSKISSRLSEPNIEWLPVLLGLLLLFVPTFYTAATSFWQGEDNAHGPIILAVVVWLIWTKRAGLFAPPLHGNPLPGIVLLVVGLSFYMLGRAVEIALVEIGSLIPILVGTLLAMRGWAVIKTFWFPIFFIVFMVPLPGTFTDALTAPLKQQVSQIAEQLLYGAGYPIARSGVMLTIGQYQLLVADACSGLNTMFSLSALGLLFMYLTGRESKWHNIVMLASILPIAFVANVIRVLVLILVTYHFGDEAGQGYLHGSAGIVLLMAALTSLLVLDSLLARVFRPRPNAKNI